MTWFKCILADTETGENDQNLYITLKGSGPHSWSPGAVFYAGFPSISSPLIWSCYWYCSYFFRLQNAGIPRSVLSFAHCPSLFQRRRWVSLWTHSRTATRSTSRLSTGKRWECVEVNTVCCCWLYWYTGKACGIPPLPKQLAPCALHQPNAATSLTVTPVHQFHLTISSWMWGCVLGSVQVGTNIFVREGAKENG